MEQIFPLLTDSYKATSEGGHAYMYPENTQYVYSYLESREGAQYANTTFVGLQALLIKYLVGVRVTMRDIDIAEKVVKAHLGTFRRELWERIVTVHGGRLPLEIHALPEGTIVPVGIPLLTVVNTDSELSFLTGHVETLLTQVYYPSNVATIGTTARNMFINYLEKTCDQGKNFPGLGFMLHDFGFRAATSLDSAAIGGMAHLVNFDGTDTMPALLAAMEYYNADVCGYSVPATEHSIMTSMGRENESQVIRRVLEKVPTGIVSIVSDSYDIFHCCEKIYGSEFRDMIIQRDGVLVVRPDSGEPVPTVIRLLNILGNAFGYTENTKGYKVLNPKVRIIWGDGIDLNGIDAILNAMVENGWSVENIVFGMGGHLLQRHNRDTQRTAFKSSAQYRNGQWHDIFKDPLDSSKKSKKGRFAVIREDGVLKCIPLDELGDRENLLKLVFLNGELKLRYTFDEIRANARI